MIMITVRELSRDDDLSAVLKLCREFFAEYESHHDEFFDTENLNDSDISARFIDSMKSDDSTTLVAIFDGRIVGYASLAVREQPSFYKIKRVGSISALMVAKEYRREGIATEIMAGARQYFKRQGIKYYTFYTSVANEPAIKLYEKLGMKPLHTSFLGET